MTLNREELIEKCVKAHEDVFVSMGWSPAKSDDANLASKLAMEAVLKAIGEYLPTGGGHYIASNPSHEIEPREAIFIPLNEAELYTQFKNICEGK
jgi:hypothetical protein